MDFAAVRAVRHPLLVQQGHHRGSTRMARRAWTQPPWPPESPGASCLDPASPDGAAGRLPKTSTCHEHYRGKLLVVEVDRIRIRDRKSTRLNSSHGYISYAVFC